MSQPDILLAVGRTVVGAMSTSITRMELLVKDVLISVMILGTVEINLILILAVLAGSVTRWLENVRWLKVEKDLAATLPVQSTVTHTLNQTNTGATLQAILVTNAQIPTSDAVRTGKQSVIIA